MYVSTSQMDIISIKGMSTKQKFSQSKKAMILQHALSEKLKLRSQNFWCSHLNNYDLFLLVNMSKIYHTLVFVPWNHWIFIAGCATKILNLPIPFANVSSFLFQEFIHKTQLHPYSHVTWLLMCRFIGNSMNINPFLKGDFIILSISSGLIETEVITQMT